jgi:hypothetical protein
MLEFLLVDNFVFFNAGWPTSRIAAEISQLMENQQ